MPNTHGPDHGQPEAFDREINVKSIVLTGVWLMAGIVVSMIFSWYFSVFLKNQQIAADPAATPLEVRGRVMPPGERLQPSPFEGMDLETPERQLDAFLAQQSAALNSYGWVSKQAGIAHIPVERAIELLVAKGLPGSAPSVEIVHFPPTAAGH